MLSTQFADFMTCVTAMQHFTIYHYPVIPRMYIMYIESYCFKKYICSPVYKNED